MATAQVLIVLADDASPGIGSHFGLLSALIPFICLARTAPDNPTPDSDAPAP